MYTHVYIYTYTNRPPSHRPTIGGNGATRAGHRAAAREVWDDGGGGWGGERGGGMAGGSAGSGKGGLVG